MRPPGPATATARHSTLAVLLLIAASTLLVLAACPTASTASAANEVPARHGVLTAGADHTTVSHLQYFAAHEAPAKGQRAVDQLLRAPPLEPPALARESGDRTESDQMIAVLAIFGSCVTIAVLVLAAVTGIQVIRGQLPVRLGWVALGTAVVVTGITVAGAAILWLTRPPQALFPSEPRSGGAATPTPVAAPALASTEEVPSAASPTPRPTTSAPPTERLGVTAAPATDAPTATSGPTPAACPGAPPQRLRIGEAAHVCTARDRLVVRSQPRKDAPEVARLDPGTRLNVVDGARCADNWSWWYVEFASGARGWVAEGGDSVDPYFVCP